MKKLVAVFITAVIFTLGACSTCPVSKNDKVKQDAQKAFNDMDAQKK